MCVGGMFWKQKYHKPDDGNTGGSEMFKNFNNLTWLMAQEDIIKRGIEFIHVSNILKCMDVTQDLNTLICIPGHECIEETVNNFDEDGMLIADRTCHVA